MTMATPQSRSQRLLTNRRLAALLVVTLGFLALAWFVADNFFVVHVRIMVWDLNVRLAWVMVVSLLVGMAIGAALAWSVRLWRR